jgi:hypothetical protein
MDRDGDGYSNLDEYLNDMVAASINSAPVSRRAPAASVVGAVSRKGCDIGLMSGMTSEPRLGGITELRIAFDVAPGEPGGNSGMILEERTCASPTFAPYSGLSTMGSRIEGDELVLTFAPALEDARSYRITLGPELTRIPGQAVQVRALIGDINSDGFVNALDRGAWMAVSSLGQVSCATDLNGNGTTDMTDKSIVIGRWTGGANCAP